MGGARARDCPLLAASRKSRGKRSGPKRILVVDGGVSLSQRSLSTHTREARKRGKIGKRARVRVRGEEYTEQRLIEENRIE